VTCSDPTWPRPLSQPAAASPGSWSHPPPGPPAPPAPPAPAGPCQVLEPWARMENWLARCIPQTARPAHALLWSSATRRAVWLVGTGPFYVHHNETVCLGHWQMRELVTLVRFFIKEGLTTKSTTTAAMAAAELGKQSADQMAPVLNCIQCLVCAVWTIPCSSAECVQCGPYNAAMLSVYSVQHTMLQQC
jgi:hypothetical protein